MGSRSKSATSTSQADNRMIVGEGALAVGPGGSYSSASSTDLQVHDDRDSTSNVTVYNADAAKVAEFNAGLLRDLSTHQTDAVKAVAGLGTEGIRKMGESVTDLYAVAGSNSARAWEHTIDASAAVLDKVFAQQSKSSDAAHALATTAMATYQPTEAKNAETLKYAAIAAAVVGALVIFRK